MKRGLENVVKGFINGGSHRAVGVTINRRLFYHPPPNYSRIIRPFDIAQNIDIY